MKIDLNSLSSSELDMSVGSYLSSLGCDFDCSVYIGKYLKLHYRDYIIVGKVLNCYGKFKIVIDGYSVSENHCRLLHKYLLSIDSRCLSLVLISDEYFDSLFSLYDLVHNSCIHISECFSSLNSSLSSSISHIESCYVRPFCDYFKIDIEDLFYIDKSKTLHELLSERKSRYEYELECFNRSYEKNKLFVGRYLLCNNSLYFCHSISDLDGSLLCDSFVVDDAKFYYSKEVVLNFGSYICVNFDIWDMCMSELLSLSSKFYKKLKE